MKFRTSLTQKGDEIKGQISTDGNAAFNLECVALIVESISKQFDVTPDQVVRDLYSIVCGKITERQSSSDTNKHQH